MRTKENKYISLQQYNNIVRRYNYLKSKGVVFIKNKNKLLFGLGLICLIVAIIPNGLGVVFYPLSFYLIAKSNIEIKIIKKIKGVLK